MSSTVCSTPSSTTTTVTPRPVTLRSHTPVTLMSLPGLLRLFCKTNRGEGWKGLVPHQIWVLSHSLCSVGRLATTPGQDSGLNGTISTWENTHITGTFFWFGLLGSGGLYLAVLRIYSVL